MRGKEQTIKRRDIVGNGQAVILAILAVIAVVLCTSLSTFAGESAAENVAIHRLYSPSTGEYFYTGYASEIENLIQNGWVDRGEIWIAPSSSESPVWRLLNPVNLKHYYTANEEECNYLEENGWVKEGVAFYSDDKMTVPIYRESNAGKAAGAGDYTTTAEGNIIAWYAVSAPVTTGTSYPEAEAILNQIGWDLQAAFNFACMKWVKTPTDPNLGTHYYATVGYTAHQGNCYVMAGTFCELAKALGYNAVQVSGVVPLRRGGLGPHSWVEIDGKVYDPDFQVESKKNGFAIWYGKSGTWVYTKKVIME